jgi:hypothetical protein
MYLFNICFLIDFLTNLCFHSQLIGSQGNDPLRLESTHIVLVFTSSILPRASLEMFRAGCDDGASV